MPAVAIHGVRGQLALQLILRRRAADRRRLARVEHQIHLSRPRLAQGACGQQPAVADALVVEYADLDVARQGQVLQAVVADDHVHLGVLHEQRLGRFGTLAGDEHRHARGACDQQRFIAHVLCRAFLGDGAAALGLAPVATRDHGRVRSPRLQMPHDGHRHWCLARASGDYVADGDHRHGHARAG
ncbi:hypothetical protein SDC9_138927 [bioreactor metagenome]|uniref:Uncharacterized protein n=1 Tax=bioreactor metagenome TaxID=1076179 RepID=A0A645DT80_9ZZZZ